FKKESPATGWLDMNEVICDLAVFLRDEAARRGVTLRTDLAPGLPRVIGDRIQLQQVVLNLVVNGMDAMAATSATGGLSKELRIASRKNGAAEILILVEDSGSGLSAEIAGKIFNPFFTTKPQGIGMGLAISRSIIESHRGRLWAEPAPSGGAVFQFTIPAGSENES
ncbi:MAG TPA: ATP-binding protein, partial [Candidatus Acidoferrales bacterium]